MHRCVVDVASLAERRAMALAPPSAALLRLPTIISHADPFLFEPITSGAHFSIQECKCRAAPALQVSRSRCGFQCRVTAKVWRISLAMRLNGDGASVVEDIGTELSVQGWKCCAVPALPFSRSGFGVQGRDGARVWGSTFVAMSLNGDGALGVEDNGSDAALWLRERLPLELERDGVEVDQSRRIGEACADACARFLATGRSFDPTMIMDAMEEEIERRDLRGEEFLPFELGRRAAKVLTQRWNELPVAERPKAYRQELFVNKKDVVDFDKWPKNLNLP